MKEAPTSVVCESVYFGESFARVLDMPQGLREEIVVRGEPSLHYLKGFAEIALVRFFPFCDLVLPIVL